MGISLQRHMIADRLGAYHPYTVDYREAHSERYKDFSPTNPRDITQLDDAALNFSWSGNRQMLCARLREGLAGLSPHENTLANIDRLADPHTVCIIAGHQPALFGGPLFVALKIMSAIRLCQILNDRNSATQYVPVYWNGSEEHNRAEFGRVTLFDREHDQIHLALPEDGKRRMAAETPAAEALTLLSEMQKILPDTEFLEALGTRIESFAAADLGQLQTRLMLHWFGAHGLVVVEPWMMRDAAVPAMRNALLDNDSIHAALAQDTQEIEDMGYPPQLQLHESERTLVFYIENGERFRIRRKGEEAFCLERRTREFGAAALLEELESHPERFSPSAALRPVVQGTVLPAFAYVAGGGELAYHVQLRHTFKQFNIPIPIMIPRPAATVAKKSLLKTMDRLELSPDRLLDNGWEWTDVEKAAEERGAGQKQAFDTFHASLHEAFSTLESSLADAGLQNLNDLRQEEKRFLGRLEGVQKRFRQQDPAVGEGPKRQYYRLRKFILPGETYQELSAWTVYFLALYGEDFLSAMLEEIDPLTPEHHLFITQ